MQVFASNCYESHGSNSVFSDTTVSDSAVWVLKQSAYLTLSTYRTMISIYRNCWQWSCRTLQDFLYCFNWLTNDSVTYPYQRVHINFHIILQRNGPDSCIVSLYFIMYFKLKKCPKMSIATGKQHWKRWRNFLFFSENFVCTTFFFAAETALNAYQVGQSVKTTEVLDLHSLSTLILRQLLTVS